MATPTDFAITESADAASFSGAIVAFASVRRPKNPLNRPLRPLRRKRITSPNLWETVLSAIDSRP